MDKSHILKESELQLNDAPKIEWIRVQDAAKLLWNENPKLHDKGALVTSIEKYGYQELSKFDKNLINQSGTTGAVVAGNGRIEALAEMEKLKKPLPRGLASLKDTGEWVMPVLVGVDQENINKARAYAIDSNNVGLLGGDMTAVDISRIWDQDTYMALLQGLSAENEEPVSVDKDTIERLARVLGEQEEPKDAEPQIDKAEELQKKWQVQTGDLYRIGEHKLLCGDSTKREDVERVMGGEKARICLTDPPYGLGEKKKSGKNDYDQHKDTKDNLIELAKLWLPIANNISDVIVFSPGVTNSWLYPEADWIMCWFYGGGQLRSSWGFNCWQPFLCYGKDPSLASGNGGRPDAINMNTPANAKDIDHPCPKPLKLWEWFIERLSFSADDIFYEPFCGSGTTMVACQNLSRKCRAIEISPAYCAVILQRMTDAFPGIIIEKIE